MPVDVHGPGGRSGQTTLPLPTVQQAHDRGRLNWDQFKWTHNTRSGRDVQSILESRTIYGSGDYHTGGYVSAGPYDEDAYGDDIYGDRSIDVSIVPKNPRFGGGQDAADAAGEDVYFPYADPDRTYNRKNNNVLGGMAVIRDSDAISSMHETTFSNRRSTNAALYNVAKDGTWRNNEDITDEMWGRFGEGQGYDRDEWLDYVNELKKYDGKVDEFFEY